MLILTAAMMFLFLHPPGKLHLISRSGRIEKSVEAHRGAVLCVCWSYDGNALVTGDFSLIILSTFIFSLSSTDH